MYDTRVVPFFTRTPTISTSPISLTSFTCVPPHGHPAAAAGTRTTRGVESFATYAGSYPPHAAAASSYGIVSALVAPPLSTSSVIFAARSRASFSLSRPSILPEYSTYAPST